MGIVSDLFVREGRASLGLIIPQKLAQDTACHPPDEIVSIDEHAVVAGVVRQRERSIGYDLR